MEWIEISARTVDEAKDLLLDQLGVDDSEAEFEVLEEPRAGLFGRVRGEARVRARLLPKEVRGREPRQKRQRGGGNGSASKGNPSKGSPSKEKTAGAASAKSPDSGAGGSGGRAGDAPKSSDRPSTTGGDSKRQEREDRAPRPESTVDPATLVPVVTEFLEGIIDAFGLSANVQVIVDNGALQASIEGDRLGQLIGPRGAVVDAIQELARTVAQKSSDGPAPRLRVDIGGYRAGRLVALEAFATDVAEQALETGKVYVLEPMGSAERKLVHDTVAAIDGVGTTSEGEDPTRRVVIARQ